ncbi:MAG: hypothetical protein U0903_17740 [Planctomycetales bacterium]
MSAQEWFENGGFSGPLFFGKRLSALSRLRAGDWGRASVEARGIFPGISWTRAATRLTGGTGFASVSKPSLPSDWGSELGHLSLQINNDYVKTTMRGDPQRFSTRIDVDVSAARCASGNFDGYSEDFGSFSRSG